MAAGATFAQMNNATKNAAERMSWEGARNLFIEDRYFGTAPGIAQPPKKNSLFCKPVLPTVPVTTNTADVRILVLSLAGIGDSLFATPLIHELREGFAGAKSDFGD